MTIASSARRPLRLAAMVGVALALPPSAAGAQTAEGAAGTGPSQALSTPPNAAPINQPGAMRRAYAHRPPKAPARHQSTPTTAPPQGATTPH